MAGISITQDGFVRRAGGGAGVGGADARSGPKNAGGVAGKRRPVDEYIASLPAQAAFIGGKTLETLTSLPPVPQPKGQAVGGVGIGVNALGGTGAGINTNRGIGADAAPAGGIGGGAAPAANNINPAGDVNISPAGAAADEPADAEDAGETGEAADVADADDKGGAELTPEEQSVVNELRNRDREVRAHEQAHISAGGAYIRGGASYQYQRGPDNKSYAVGGEVGIDTAPERDDPGATITKMQAVRAAALAPADPSAQDRAVAAAAARNESIARAELAEEEKTK